MASIEERGKNSYRIVVSKPKTNGKGYTKEYKTVTLPDNLTEKQKQKELEKVALLFEEEVKKGNYLDGEKITLAEFVEIWMKEYAEKELSPSTLTPYKLRLEKRILPALGHLKLAKIQPQHIMSFYNNLTETGVRMDVLYKPSSDFMKMIENTSHKSLKEKTGVGRNVFARMKSGGSICYETTQKLCEYFNIATMDKYFIVQDTDKTLSSKTIRHHHTLLSGIFSMAVEWNMIQSNPTQRVRLPSITKAKSTPANYYDDKQLADLFTALEGEPIKYKSILYLTIDTGLRLSEVAGLTWEHVDLKKQTIDILQQRQYVSGHGILEQDPKSDSGIRIVTISNFATNIMNEYRKHQIEMRLKCGSAWYSSDVVFTHDDGMPIFPRRPSVWFGEFLKRKNLPHITFHGLRHTNASLMIASGVDIVTVSGRLGHADKNVTLNTYSHIIKSREQLVANKMDQFYGSIDSSDKSSTL